MAEYFIGLDLGQAQDYSALTVIERVERYPAGVVPDPETTPRIAHYAVRHLKRWPLGTSYPEIVRDVVALCERPPLPGSLLAVDATGVGRAVVNLLRRPDLKARLVPIT